jgi:penicillin-binding protein 1C
VKRKRRIALGLSLAGLLLLALSSLYWPFPKSRLNPAPVISLRVFDRNNALLREVLSDEGGRCHWLTLGEVSRGLLQAVVAAEDRSFFRHSGVNPYSVVRAFFQNLSSRRVVSGASTITQQLVRNIYHGRRTILSKVFEAWMAVRLEHTLSKDEILLQYLNRIPFGNQAFGIEAAARLYFGKPASQLSLAEAAFLAGLPRSPSTLNPYRSLRRAKAKQEEILAQMQKMGFIGAADKDRSTAEPLVIIPEHESFRAPHFCDFILSGLTPLQRQALSAVQTTLDGRLQEKVEILLRNHLKQLSGRGISNGAAIVLDNASGDVLAMVGSRDFFDSARDGQVNGALSLRQPGSTIKAFTYALALESGMTAASVIEDAMVQFSTDSGAYRPRNYDEKYHGPVRMRSALASSYNIPAVTVLQALGTDRLYLKLKALGFESLKKGSDYYGLGLTLGNGEVTLLELVRAYACLARGGLYSGERSVAAMVDKKGRRLSPSTGSGLTPVFSPQVAYIITDILADKDARIPSFGYHSPISLPFPAAAKTGTSKDFRDNWTIGYTPRFTVGVWVGNFDGTPMANVSGITGCGPLFRDIMLLLEKGAEPREFPVPAKLVKKAICPLSGLLPNANCPGQAEEIFIQGTEPKEVCRLTHTIRATVGNRPVAAGVLTGPATLKILFPQDGDIFKLDPILRKNYQSLKLRARVPDDPAVTSVTWWVNGRNVGEAEAPFIKTWNLVPGSYIIKVTATSGGKLIESPPVKVTVTS